MTEYKIGIREEISGFIGVEANSKEKAEELAEELINEYGVEDCLYNGLSTCAGKILWSKHYDSDREVLSCEEIKREPKASLSDLPLEF